MYKKKGFEEYFAVPVILLVLFAILFYFVNLAVDIDKSRELHLVLRKYAMLMESAGCLSYSEQARLVQELETLGASNIVFNGSPAEKAAYADTVMLSVSGTLEVSNIIGYHDFTYVRNGNSIYFEKTLQSTAQY